ncbi:MAG: cytochrome c [Chloroflexota bacterium]|nr:MAG: cytochrome c [Chloroflexota bacterium]
MQRMVFPTIAAMVVVALAVLLLSIGARSPYTHANLMPRFDPSYVRTSLAFVGSPAAGHPVEARVELSETHDQIDRGKVLLIRQSCAACHGLEGRGGIVGPPIIGFDAADLRAKTDRGPGGMPAYASGALEDADLEAIAAFLKSLAAPTTK